MHFQVVTRVDNQFVIHDHDDLGSLLCRNEVRGYAYSSLEKRACLRPELKGQPKFLGLIGPLWGGTHADGEPIIRYEDHAAEAILSA